MSQSNTMPELVKQLAKEYRELLRLRAKVAKLSAKGPRRKAHDRNKRRKKSR